MLIPIGFFGAGAAAGAYELISTAYGTGSSGTIEFASIPSTYKWLEIRITARSTVSSAPDYYFVRFNSDTGNNYAAHGLDGNGSTVSSWGYTTQNNMTLVGYIPGNNSTANAYSAAVMSVADYASTSKNKTMRALAGGNPYAQVSLTSGLWMNTAAVSNIKIISGAGANWTTASRFSLYGVKG